MPFAKKKPVVIEFQEVTIPAIHTVAKWCGGTVIVDDFGPFVGTEWYITIPTLEGTMRASVHDLIIKGVNGEFYPCKPDIFDKTYDIVEEKVIFTITQQQDDFYGNGGK
jgi:hypothetical protein